MTVWILTIGSSDITLTEEGHEQWLQYFDEVKSGYSDLQKIESTVKNVLEVTEDEYSVKARLLGYVYSQHKDEYKEHLKFPLLQSFYNRIDVDSKLEYLKSVIVLLTNQEKLFTEKPMERKNPDCPYWQDTCTLQEIITWYIEDNLCITPEFITIEPREKEGKLRGVDHWDAMLGEVKTKLKDKIDQLNLKVDENETVYVSHQAGTPAISSAIQFETIGQFGERVKFLVANKSFETISEVQEADVIESSSYWRDFQIDRAKQLIRRGEPGAALTILEPIKASINELCIKELTQLAVRFNLREQKDPGRDLIPAEAVKRIQDALDLVEILLKNEQYVLGIIVLASSHETFLKASLTYLSQSGNYESVSISNDDIKSDNEMSKCIHEGQLKNSDKINWDQKGLFIKTEDNKKCPLKKYNSWLYSLLLDIANATSCELRTWNLLDYIGTHKRGFEQDRRNQSVHNLRGVTVRDTLSYLLGNPKLSEQKYQDYLTLLQKNGNPRVEDVVRVYQTEVQTPFRQAIKDVGLSTEDRSENKLQQELDDLADRLGETE